MRVSLLLAMVGLACVVGSAQSGVGEDTIVFGSVRLNLGQTQESALSSLRRFHEVRPLDEKETFSSWSVWTKGPAELNNTGNVWFENGRLTGASLGWVSGQDERRRAVPFASALYGAVREMAGDDGRSCTVRTGSLQGPTNENKAVFIICGKKHVRIDVTRSQYGDWGSISEVIGGVR